MLLGKATSGKNPGTDLTAGSFLQAFQQSCWLLLAWILLDSQSERAGLCSGRWAERRAGVGSIQKTQFVKRPCNYLDYGAGHRGVWVGMGDHVSKDREHWHIQYGLDWPVLQGFDNMGILELVGLQVDVARASLAVKSECSFTWTAFQPQIPAHSHPKLRPHILRSSFTGKMAYTVRNVSNRTLGAQSLCSVLCKDWLCCFVMFCLFMAGSVQTVDNMMRIYLNYMFKQYVIKGAPAQCNAQTTIGEAALSRLLGLWEDSPNYISKVVSSRISFASRCMAAVCEGLLLSISSTWTAKSAQGGRASGQQHELGSVAADATAWIPMPCSTQGAIIAHRDAIIQHEQKGARAVAKVEEKTQKQNTSRWSPMGTLEFTFAKEAASQCKKHVAT